MGRIGKYNSAVLSGLKTFGEAMNARVEAYTADSYQCPWSQRSPQFMFQEFGLKQYYDAANTGCCYERIRPFGSKPQYAEQTAPMTPKECFREITAIGCSNLEAPDKAIDGCASSDMMTQFNVICPKLCDQVSNLTEASYAGKYGKFSLVAKDTEEDWVIKYVLSADVRANAYNRCVGEIEYTEHYCEIGSIRSKVRASLSDPDGCYCDCCGTNGLFPAPTHQWQNQTIGASYANSVSVNPVLNTACKNGAISNGVATWPDGLGNASFSWVTDSTYESDGVSHYVQRLGSIGDANHSVCCGFDYALTGYDGCSWSGVYSGTVARKAALPSLSPSSGEWITGSYRNVYVNGSCVNSGKNSISVTRSCVEPSAESVSKSGETLTWGAQINLTPGHTCSGCCGNGSLSVAYNDGCNKNGTGTISVRQPEVLSLAGHVYRCLSKVDGWYYGKVDLNCGGGETYLSDTVGGPYLTLSACDAVLRENAKGHAVYSSACAGKGCLWIGENGLTGSARRVATICVKDTACCKISSYGYLGEWVTNNGDCCNRDGTAA